MIINVFVSCYILKLIRGTCTYYMQSACNEMLHVAVQLLPRRTGNPAMTASIMALLDAVSDDNATARGLLSRAGAATAVCTHVLCAAETAHSLSRPVVLSDDVYVDWYTFYGVCVLRSRRFVLTA